MWQTPDTTFAVGGKQGRSGGGEKGDGGIAFGGGKRRVKWGKKGSNKKKPKPVHKNESLRPDSGQRKKHLR